MEERQIGLALEKFVRRRESLRTRHSGNTLPEKLDKSLL